MKNLQLPVDSSDFVYKKLLRPLLFCLPSETAHRMTMHTLAVADRLRLGRWIDAMCAIHAPELETSCMGLSFQNPFGLAAGFDKNAEAPGLWPAFGFGHVELGTVTGLPQPGNPTPRLFRLIGDRALINRMGFNSMGREAFYTAFKAHRQRGLPAGAVYGINLGKSKVTALPDAAREYAESARLLAPLADYLSINVSSPNTPGLRELQDKDMLGDILAAVMGETQGQKPLLLKIAPDLTATQLDDILTLVETHRLSGIIATNTTIARDSLTDHRYASETGGLSGAPLKARSTEVITHLARATHGRLPIIGVGGIETACDVYEKIAAGAHLVQLYTGFIYGGPCTIATIARELVTRLRSEGLKTVKDLIGQALR